MALVHTSKYQPRVFPFKDGGSPSEIDRLQDMTASVTIDRTKIKEIGNENIVDWKTGIPTVNLALRQLEYGNIEFWRKLANKADSVETLILDDFKTPTFFVLCKMVGSF